VSTPGTDAVDIAPRWRTIETAPDRTQLHQRLEVSVIRLRLRRSLAPVAVASALALLGGIASSGLALANAAPGRSLATSAARTDAARSGQSNASGQGKAKAIALLLDHGGPVLLHSHTVAIFWGPTSAFEAGLETAMPSLLAGMNGSAYLGVAQQYMRSTTQIGSSFDGSIQDTSTPPKQALSPSDLGTEVAKVVPAPDPSTIYFVFTSNLPKINYCAYHSDATANGVLVEVAYVPRQPAGCSPLTNVNLQANTYSEGVQAAADSAAHEFMEAVTDPHLDAWYDKNGYEIADKCEYDYQGVVHLANHTTWQIQSEWSNAIAACDPALGK
jgi:hypothetical protein